MVKWYHTALFRLRRIRPTADSLQDESAVGGGGVVISMKDSYWIYILESLLDGTRYIGSTSKSVEERLRRHNIGDYRFTKGHRPWKIIYTEPVKSQSEAVKRDVTLKAE